MPIPRTLPNWLLTTWATPVSIATLAGRRWFPLWGTVYHRGRRSGRAFRVPIVVFGTSDEVVLPLLFGPNADWVRNVQAANGCVLHWRGWMWHMIEPKVIDAAEARAHVSARTWQLSEMLVRPDEFLYMRRGAEA